MELITIKFSHYNEKARWGLDRFGVEYTERPYLPMVHFPFVMARTRLLRGSDSVSSPASTPVLITDRSVIADSEEILKYVSGVYGTPETTLYPHPEAAELSARFSRKLGVHTRRLIYYHAFQQPELLRAMGEANVPGWQASAFSALIPVFSALLHNRFKLTPETAADSTRRIRDELAFVNDRLSDGRRYLTGDRFTAADLTFASMMAPVLLVQPHEGYGAKLPSVEECSAEVQAVCRELREAPAGKFAMRMFAEERAPRR